MNLSKFTPEEIAVFIQNVWFDLSEPGDTDILKQIFELQMELYGKYKILPSSIKTIFEEEEKRNYPTNAKELLYRLFELDDHLQSIYAEQYLNN